MRSPGVSEEGSRLCMQSGVNMWHAGQGGFLPRGVCPWVAAELGAQGITVIRHSFQSK